MPVLVFFDLSSEINAIYPTFAQELGLPIKPTDVSTQKIDCTMLDTFKIVVAVLVEIDKANRVRFLKGSF